MSKLNLFLLAAVLGSSLLLVNTAYESRRVFAALDRARKDALKLCLLYTSPSPRD